MATCPGELTQLLDLWRGADVAIVVDSVARTIAHPGRIQRVDAKMLEGVVSATSSHAFGVAEAVRLGRALGALPDALVVFGVDADRLDLGIGLSGAVAVVEELERSRCPAGRNHHLAAWTRCTSPTKGSSLRSWL